MALPNEEEPLAVAFVARCAAAWRNICHEDDQLARAMLAHAVSALIAANDEHEIAGLLVGIAAQINPDASAGHA